MFKFITLDNRTIIRLVADLVVISGVVILGWNPARMSAFYYLDTCIVILFFLIYNFILNRNFIISGIVAGVVIAGIMLFYYRIVLDISVMFGFNKASDGITGLLYPYFDVAAFLSFAVFSYVADLKKWLSYDAAFAKPAFAKLLATNLLLIPGLLLGGALLHVFIQNEKVALIIALLVVRHFIEHMRYRSFCSVEKESTEMAEDVDGFFREAYFDQYLNKDVYLSPIPKRLNPLATKYMATIEKQVTTADSRIYYLAKLYNSRNKVKFDYFLLSPKKSGITEFSEKHPIAGLLKINKPDQFDPLKTDVSHLSFVSWVKIIPLPGD